MLDITTDNTTPEDYAKPGFHVHEVVDYGDPVSGNEDALPLNRELIPNE